MANVDMCEHEWPGSGCGKCRLEMRINLRHPGLSYIYCGSAVIQTKKLSKKMSWTEHFDPRQADRQAQQNLTSTDGGRPYRFCYRVNVYYKHSVENQNGYQSKD